MTKREMLKIAKPILFNTEMARAILTGKKTVTRRVAKFDNYIIYDEESEKYTLLEEDGGYSEGWTIQELKLNGYIKPRYRKGDILYVKETWCRVGEDVDKIYFEESRAVYDGQVLYRADGIDLVGIGNWRPSIHMPKEAARLFLKVTDVRVEKLQDITSLQAKAEGIVCDCLECLPYITANICFKSYVGHFQDLWNSTIKKQHLDRYGWEANPCVWVIEFERCR